MADLDPAIIKIICGQLLVVPNKVVREARLFEDLGADSIDIVELSIDFEEEFGIQIPDADVERMATVGDAEEIIEKMRVD
jgi:acyl carrier protein